MFGPENIPNWTIGVQLLIFFVCYYVMSRFLFAPYLELIEARKGKTSDLKEKSIHDKARAEKLQHDYEAFLHAERQRLSKWTDEERKKISETERFEIQKARTEAGETVKKARAELSAEIGKVRSELNPMVAEYSSQIASKVLGRKIKISGSQVESHAEASQAESVV